MSTPLPIGGGRVFRLHGALAIAVLFLLLLGEPLLATAGVELPHIHGLGPLGDLRVVAALALLGISLRTRMTGGPLQLGAAAGIGAAELAPLGLAVIGVNVFLDETRPLVGALTSAEVVPRTLSAPLYRLGMAGVLLAGVAGLIAAVPRYRLRLLRSASNHRLRTGLFFTVAVLAVLYAVLLSLGQVVAGLGEVRLKVPLLLPATLALGLGQLVIAVGEELFYRGLLQSELGRLLAASGIQARHARPLGLVAVSVLFACQHVRADMPPHIYYAVLLYAFAMSVLFGFLFELTGNLAVCSLAHLFNNLTVLRIGPYLAAGPAQVEAFGVGVYVTAYLLIAFSFLYILNHNSSPSLAPIRPRD